MAWTHLFGKTPIATKTPTVSTDRLVAVDCALRTIPATAIASGAYQAGEITTRAHTFEHWLAEARGDEQDAQIRRLLLLMVCERADPDTPRDRIKALVKELHRYATRR